MESLRAWVRRFRGSLLVMPLAIVIAAIVAARLVTLLDHDQVPGEIPGLLSISVAGGRAIAGSVAGATITVAAIVFSITSLSSQIAATQYSPRAVAGFLEDRLQKVVIGLIVGTFVFSLMVLADLSGVALPDEPPRPSVAVTLVLLLGIASAVAILVYLDHSLRRMRIDAVVRRIAEAAAKGMRDLDRTKPSGEKLEERGKPEVSPIRVGSTKTGWVLAIDAQRLCAQMPAESVTRIAVRVGEAVFAGDQLATVWIENDDDSVQRLVQGAIRLGRDRTASTHPTYGIRQLVDIGLRALSPGVNDPTTAIDVIQHLKLPMREMLTLDPPRRVFAGSRGQRVFLPEAQSRSDQVRMAFSELRLAAAGQPVVLETIVEVLADLADELAAADQDGRTSELRKQAALAVDLACTAGLAESDLEPVLAAADRLSLRPEPETDEADA
jgi:uncharacterized membrane protein